MSGVTQVLQRIAQIESGLARLGGTSAPASLEGAGFSAAMSSAVSGASLQGFTATSVTAGRGQQAVDLAKTFMGVPYVWGGEGPKGFDCSGLVKYVYGKLGVDLPHYTVTQAQKGTPVDRGDLQPGDVIFFCKNKETGFLHHVGIYVGDNSFIHAPQTGDVVKVSKLEGYYDRVYACARRYL